MANSEPPRAATATEWADEDPVLAFDELGLVVDTGQYVVGDGTTAFAGLTAAGGGGGGGLLADPPWMVTQATSTGAISAPAFLVWDTADVHGTPFCDITTGDITDDTITISADCTVVISFELSATADGDADGTVAVTIGGTKPGPLGDLYMSKTVLLTASGATRAIKDMYTTMPFAMSDGDVIRVGLSSNLSAGTVTHGYSNLAVTRLA